MADPSVFKLFRIVDPSTVNVPIKEKFAKLTLSSNKKKQLENEKEQKKQKRSSVSRQLLAELSDQNKNPAAKSYEHPLLRSDSSSSVVMGVEHTPKSTQLDVSDYMEALQLSGTQRTLDFDVEQLSTEVSNLTMQPKTRQQPPQEVSICISSTTEEEANDNDDGEDEDDDEDSCITISDTSGSECDPQPAKEQEEEEVQVEESMAVSELPIRSAEELPGLPLTIDKVERIQAFLRDVSFERHEMLQRGVADMSAEHLLHSRIASADTESMSQDIDCTQLPSPASSPKRPLDSSKLLADNDTEVNTVCSDDLIEPDSSKRLANNDTEVNTICTEEQLEQDSSKRLAHNDTEVNTPDIEEPLSELSAHHSTLNDVDPNESITIPETSSEAEPSPARPCSATSTERTSGSGETEMGTPAIQVSSINISAKINIKIHIPNMDSSSAESDDGDTDADADADADANDKENYVESPPEQSDKQEQQRQEKNRSKLCEDASEDEQFLTNAEQLLNQLYGKSWQTPDVIRTLKRSSGSGGKAAAPTVDRTPLTEVRRQPRARRGAATTAKKRIPANTVNESALGDFSLFKRALHATKLNSTHLPTTTAARSERATKKQRVRTNHVHEDRWRALVDSDSGTDASDDEDADATNSSSESDVDDGHVTYLDLTKTEVEVVSNPDSETECKSPGFPKKLDDILRTCRATEKPKMCATPSTPITTNPTRRQLFTPNTGYEDEAEAKTIVDQAIELDSLEQLELVYLPGTNVHRRVQEVKKQLGIAIESPKTKSVFKLPTPKAAPIAKTVERARKVATPRLNGNRKCSFIKSLDSNINRDLCDNEAFFFRENFNRNKEDLAKRLYNIFNAEVFDNKLDVPITWSKLLRNTAGRCKNKRKLDVRSSVVELSVKVLTSADRLRCTLVHELCHAAAWIFNGEGGHGRVWKMWAQRAMDALPDLPPIQVCHNYAIEFKYSYKCNTCNIGSHSHTRSRKVEDLRCRQCSGPITLQLNKKDKQGNIVATPVRQATGFAKYVKDNFKKHKRDNLTAAQVMRILSVEYAKEKNKNQGSNADVAESQASIANQVETLVLD